MIARVNFFILLLNPFDQGAFTLYSHIKQVWVYTSHSVELLLNSPIAFADECPYGMNIGA